MTAQHIESNTQRTVVVTGAQGVSGAAVLRRYAALPGTTVYGVSRRPVENDGNARHISVDLLNADDVKAKLDDLRETTHLFFGAYIDKQNAAEKSEVNVRILKNLLDALAEAPLLRHITIFQGGKAYGSDLGPYQTPDRAADVRQLLLRSGGSAPHPAEGQKVELHRLASRWSNLRPFTGQPTEPYFCDRRIRNDLSRDGLTTSLPRSRKDLSSAVSGHIRRSAGSCHSVGGRNDGCTKPDLQRHQWRHSPLAAYVAADSKDVRDGHCRSGSIPAYNLHGGQAADVGRDREERKPAAHSL